MEVTTADNIFNQLCRFLQDKGKVNYVSETFGQQINDEDRIRIAIDLLDEFQILKTKGLETGCCKSLEKSVELRNSGNKAFQKKDDAKALLLYTRSIAFAPFPVTDPSANLSISEALSLAFANRSAVLLSLGKYLLSLSDISEALKYNYPHKLLYKLFERQAKCLHYLGRIKDAMECVDNALKWLPSATGLSEEKKKTIQFDLQTFLNHLKNLETNVDSPIQKESALPLFSYNQNKEILCASDCVELNYSSEMGRYISATRNIYPGDVLAVEKPFASVLLPSCYKTHCYSCLRRCDALLPCCYCSTVMYCSKECRSSSWNSNHRTDCSILPSLQKLEIGKMGHLALRIVLSICQNKDLKKTLSDLENETSTEKRNKGFNKNGHYSSSDYAPIYWLVGNTEKRSVGDLFKRSVIAACILHCLENLTEFFSEINDKESSGNHYKYLIGGLLLRHLQNLPCNAHEVSELVKADIKNTEEENTIWESIEIGAAAYAMLSLVNHSCDPNVVRHSYNGEIAVLRAIRPIRKDEQILDNYGYHYALHTKAERRSHLESQYYFTCECEACKEDWPCYDSLPSKNPTYICTRCKQCLPSSNAGKTECNIVICTNCKESQNMTDIIRRIQKSSEEFQQNLECVVSGKNGVWTELAQNMTAHLNLLDRHIQRPWKEFNDCQEAIKQCYAMTANCYEQ